MNALAVKGLCKRYPAFSLENVNFSVPEGAVMGFIGRNGAGKSTTLKALLGLVHPDAGEVTVLGKSFREEDRSIKERIGVVLGGIDFYPKKKVRLLSDVTRRFYGNWQEEKYRHYLTLFGIDQEKRVDQLSTGMRVKYMIALALSHDARLLILDEPTSGLDPVSRSELTELLRRIAADGQRSVLFSTHITSDLEKCASHITFIKDGTIQHTGTLADFRQHYDYLRQPGQELTEKIDIANRVQKFVDCRTKDVSRREIYIVEGDSALGACKQSRDAEFQGLMPVRGKILNCLKADYARIFKSDVITDLMRVLGCGVEVQSKQAKDLSAFNLENLRWNKVIICTDAAVIPFPRPDTTPPVTNTYLTIVFSLPFFMLHE